VDGWDGPVHADAAEVAATRWASLADTAAEARRDPGCFTAWFLEEMELLGWPGAGARAPAAAAQGLG